ncbi:class I SAM-dependent methyltransferase [Candidatus Neptunochlamydia vexilliferae]|uniref:Methyltransferase type 11 domain-containing protein n=1 Tax=Candidatus Neptunichlamydia vexilliferae TaxID=1651774 RepID=A0ABS0AWS8_9BACT|nr:methyltransferase domain-containing protein [Candidatus Neptunochlamydia vexilliferae]MBF5058594.1 hypothetical protein [Candidatus Neptunochlamydia vexilliferae]
MALKKNTLPRLDSVESMYEDSLHEISLFEGGFINFGYWTQSLPCSRNFSKKERLESEKNLYRYVGKELAINQSDVVLDLGCGLGLGTKLIAKEFLPKEIVGIDSSTHQINKANHLDEKVLAPKLNVRFQLENACHLSFKRHSFDKIISIEAVQHFESLMGFLKEAYKVLKANGNIGIATFFGTSEASFQKSANLIPTIKSYTDKLFPIQEVISSLEQVGFINIKVESIGKHVWPQLDKWISQGDLKDSWDKNWYIGYKQDLYDYYVVTAKKK